MIFNKKCVEQLAWRGYEEYARLSTGNKSLAFKDLSETERNAWISATDRILELAMWELENKLKI